MKRKYSHLREKATELLQSKGLQLKEEDYEGLKSLIEELNVYHIELELQNQELHNANDALEKEKQKYSELYMEAPVPYFTLTRTGNILELNFAAARLIGLPIHQINQTSMFPYIEKNSKKIFTQYFKDLFKTKQINFGEITFVKPDKSLVHTKMSAYVYYDNDKKQDLCRCIADDLTKEKEFNRKLAASENRFKTFFHADKSIKIIIEQNTGVIIDANLSAKEYYDYPVLIGKNINEINISSKEDVKKQMQNAVLYRKNYFQFKHRLATGGIRDVEVYSTPMQISGKNVLFSIIHDITAQKEAEEKLNKQNELLKSITDNMFDMVSLSDIKGNFKFLGKSHERLGYELDYMLSKNVLDFVHPDDLDFVKKSFERFLNNAEGYDTITTRYMRKDGNYVWLQIFGKILDENTILFSSRDITQTKQHEAKLKELVEELKIANYHKDRFINLLAHDLKTPFNGMLGLTGILIDEFENMNKEEVYDDVMSLYKLICSTDTLLSNILDWSRLQTGKISLKPEKVNIYDLIFSQISIISQTAKNKDIEINTDIQNDLEAVIDEHMIKTVVRNLINNAVKFTNNSGKIIVSAHKTYDNLEISVTDNGIGMTSNKVETLFSYDKTESELGTDGETGTGFGLQLCKEFVAMHTGTIDVSSVEGKGSAFTIKIPVSG